MFKFAKKSVLLGGLAVLFLAVFVFGIYLGYQNRPAVQKVTDLFDTQTPQSLSASKLDFDSFWQIWNLIETQYVGNANLDKQNMLWGAMSGLVSSLKDPYSVFLPPQQAKIFQSTVEGDFEGVGMEIGMKNGIITVIAPLKSTPAERAGIKAGDQIVKIDDKPTDNLSVDEAVNLIRGPKGTTVTLAVIRQGEENPLEIKVTRDVIQIPVLETQQKPNGIFVISLYSFSATSPSLFRNALRDFINSGSTKLILDLRGDPGGYLESAVDIASWFLPIGDVVAREKFSTGEETIYRSRGYDIFNDKFKMVILVDRGSASASEILAGALSEHGKATLVGETTYGKGSVQELLDIEGGGSLKLTIAKWLTPDGKSISDQGLEPDVKVAITQDDLNAHRDPQMDKAVEILTKS